MKTRCSYHSHGTVLSVGVALVLFLNKTFILYEAFIRCIFHHWCARRMCTCIEGGQSIRNSVSLRVDNSRKKLSKIIVGDFDKT